MTEILGLTMHEKSKERAQGATLCDDKERTGEKRNGLVMFPSYMQRVGGVGCSMFGA